MLFSGGRMNTSLKHIEPIPFKIPSCLIINGPTGCGKSFLMRKILANRDQVFNKKIGHTVYIYKEYVPIFDTFPADVHLHKGLITDYDALLSENQSKGPQLLVIDDHQGEIGPNEVKLANILASKYQVFLIVLLQNTFPKNKFARELSRSAGYS